jgi:hypothetical protein
MLKKELAWIELKLFVAIKKNLCQIDGKEIYINMYEQENEKEQTNFSI